jgi:hypothetical protein
MKASNTGIATRAARTPSALQPQPCLSSSRPGSASTRVSRTGCKSRRTGAVYYPPLPYPLPHSNIPPPPPPGALNPRRWEFFADRFESLRADGRGGDMPPFHYGSHYSSAGTVGGCGWYVCGCGVCVGGWGGGGGNSRGAAVLRGSSRSAVPAPGPPPFPAVPREAWGFTVQCFWAAPCCVRRCCSTWSAWRASPR